MASRNGGRMDVFELRNGVVADYGSFVRSFVSIRDQRVAALVEHELKGGMLWPEPLLQLNPAFEPGESLDALVHSGLLHPECPRIFANKEGPTPRQLVLHRRDLSLRHREPGELRDTADVCDS